MVVVRVCLGGGIRAVWTRQKHQGEEGSVPHEHVSEGGPGPELESLGRGRGVPSRVKLSGAENLVLMKVYLPPSIASLHVACL